MKLNSLAVAVVVLLGASNSQAAQQIVCQNIQKFSQTPNGGRQYRQDYFDFIYTREGNRGTVRIQEQMTDAVYLIPVHESPLPGRGGVRLVPQVPSSYEIVIRALETGAIQLNGRIGETLYFQVDPRRSGAPRSWLNWDGPIRPCTVSGSF